MSELSPPLAELGSVEKTVIMVLAVAGGFLIGFLLTGIVGKILGKFVFKRESSERFARFVRFLGGVAGAILVYYLLQGEGGLGLGGRGGGDTSNANKDSPKQTTPKKETPKDEQPKPRDKSEEAGDEVIITVLRSDSPAKKFYLLDSEAQPITLDDLLGKIDARAKLDNKEPGKKAVNKAQILPVKTSTGKVDTEYSVQAASLLEAKLRERGIKTYRE
jgi:hypothetical protein